MATDIVLRLRVEGEADIERLKDALQELDVATEEVEKSQTRYSGAIRKSNPVVQKLDSLTGGLVTTFLDLSDSVKKANISLQATRTALIATGIGAFVVAVGLLVAYWDDIDSWVRGVNRRLEKQLVQYELITKEIEHQEKLLKNEQTLAELREESATELLKKEQDLVKEKRKTLKLTLENLKAQLALEMSKREEFTFAEKLRSGLLILLGQNTLAAESIAEGVGANITSVLQDKINEVEQAISDSDVQIAQLNQKITESQRADEGTPGVAGVLPKGGIMQGALMAEIEIGEGRIANAQHVQRAMTEAEEANAEARKRIIENESAAKISALEQYAMMAMQLSGIVGRQTAAGKALAIASTTVSTYLSAQKAYESQLTIPSPDAPFRAALAAGIAIASGLKNVQSILSVKVPNYGGGGVSSAGIRGSQPSAPSVPNFNVVGNTGINQIGQVLNGQADTATRAYVVFGDIEKASQIENEAIQGATL